MTVGRRRATNVGALCVAGFLASSSIALGHVATWAWTETKAERIVIRDGTVRLPPSERAPLESQLQKSLELYLQLEQFAWTETGDQDAAALYHHIGYGFRRALGKVRTGLAIVAADCTGSGRVLSDHRYRNFRCVVTSERVEIPSPTLITSDDGEILAVVEGQPRTLGPLTVRLAVHVTGRSSLTHRQIG